MRCRRMRTLQTGEIELFAPQLRRDAVIAQVERFNIAIIRCAAEIGGAVLVVFSIQRPALLCIHRSARPPRIQRLQVCQCRNISRTTSSRNRVEIYGSPGFIIFSYATCGNAAGNFSQQQWTLKYCTVRRRDGFRHMPPHSGFIAIRAGYHGEDGVQTVAHTGVVIQRGGYRDFGAMGIRTGNANRFATIIASNAANFCHRIIQ